MVHELGKAVAIFVVRVARVTFSSFGSYDVSNITKICFINVRMLQRREMTNPVTEKKTAQFI